MWSGKSDLKRLKWRRCWWCERKENYLQIRAKRGRQKVEDKRKGIKIRMVLSKVKVKMKVSWIGDIRQMLITSTNEWSIVFFAVEQGLKIRRSGVLLRRGGGERREFGWNEKWIGALKKDRTKMQTSGNLSRFMC